MSTWTSKETPVVTLSKDLWERYTTLLNESYENIEVWVKDRAYVNLQALTDLLAGDLSNHNQLWASTEQVQLVTADRLAYDTWLKA